MWPRAPGELLSMLISQTRDQRCSGLPGIRRIKGPTHRDDPTAGRVTKRRQPRQIAAGPGYCRLPLKAPGGSVREGSVRKGSVREGSVRKGSVRGGVCKEGGV